MGVPQVNLNVLDGGLSQAIPAGGNIEYVIGIGSTGPYYQVVTSTNPATFQANGSGPGIEAAGFIANSTGNPVAFVAVPAASPGTNTAVVPNTPGGSTSVMTLSGTPNDTYYAVCTVITGGTIGVNGIQVSVSLDAGRTIYGSYNLGTSSTLAVTGTGLTLNFAAGTLVAADKFSWVSSEPTWSDAAVQSAINALVALPSLLPEDIIVVGGSAQRNGAGTVGCTAGDATAFDGYMTTLFNKKRFNRLLCEAGDALWGGASSETEAAWMTSLETAFVNVSSLRVGVCAGNYNVISPYSQTQFRRSLLWCAAARDSQVAIQVDLGRVSDGALANLVLPTTPDGYIYHDENVNPGLDAARFLTARGFLNRPGLFITNPNLMCPPGSDFNWLQHGHVIDGACLIAYNYFIEQLSSSVRVGSNGYILKQDALGLQYGCNAQLANGLTNAGAVSSATCVVSQTDLILSTATLTVTVSVVPLGYLKTINVTITFVNPAVVQVSAN
jgi:Protein of unknown function (DUF2586)